MATTKKTAPEGAAAPALDPTPAQQTAAATQAEKTALEPIYLECHVLPLLDAIVWMGLASNKLSEVENFKTFMPDMRWMDDITGPECTNAGDLLSGIAWAAADLLRRHLREQEGGAA